MFLGTTMDGLYRLKCPVSLDTDYADRVQFHQSADGSQAATVFGGLTGARTWNVGYSALTPRDSMFLSSFTDSRAWYGRGPVCFIPTSGERTNMLTREESTLARATSFVASPVMTTDGPVMGYVNSTVDVNVAEKLPLPAVGERRFRLSFYASGPTYSRVDYWRGESIIQTLYFTHPTMSGYSRTDIVYPEVSGSKFVGVYICGNFTAPAVTLGTELYAYGPGTRVDSVLVTASGDSMQYAGSTAPNQQSYSKRAFKITELRQGDFL